MKGLILAAGQGIRLRPLTFLRPKCLVQVLGKPILKSQLESLERGGVRECVIVLGYFGEQVRDLFGSKFGRMALTYVENPLFYETNNLYSLWLARTQLHDDVLLLESDLLFEYELLQEVLDGKHPNVAVVDRFRTGMDGTVVFEVNGIIESMVLKADQSKGFNYSDAYKTVNIYRFDQKTMSEIFLPHLTQFVELGKTNQFYESVLADLIATGDLAMHVQKVGNRLWSEIDTLGDLSLAEQTFGSIEINSRN